MSFFKQMMQDAQPKADTLINATKNITNKAIDNKVVSVAKNVGYKALVNTVGVAVCMAAPVASKMWSKVEELAASPAPAAEVKK